MARVAFNFEFTNRPAIEPAHYDFRTIHDRTLGGGRGYIYNKARILEELKAFVTRQQRGDA